jgi:hypothetical protein
VKRCYKCSLKIENVLYKESRMTILYIVEIWSLSRSLLSLDSHVNLLLISQHTVSDKDKRFYELIGHERDLVQGYNY